MIGGAAILHPRAYGHTNPPPMPSISVNASPEVVHQGALLYGGNCAHCHGINAVAGVVPDLRYSSKRALEGFDGIVLGGSCASLGMPSFEKILTPEQVRAIQAYIVSRIRESTEPAQGQPKQ